MFRRDPPFLKRNYSGGSLRIARPMTDTTPIDLLHRPKRADARRNYDSLVVAAKEAFTERGAEASLEDIARRAGVGIGTLYRNFPTRHALLEAIYIGEVAEMARVADELGDLDAWDALETWLRRYVRFAATKRALAEEMLATLDREANVFMACRAAITDAGGGLLVRAQAAGVARPDASISDVTKMIYGISAIPAGDPEQTERILDIALDGLRAR